MAIDIVLVRMDKIGDLVVSMPVDEHPIFAGQRVHWFISEGLAFVGEQAVPRRLLTEFKRRFKLSEFLRMKRWLSQEKPRTIVLLHAPWWVSFAAWLSGIPERVGRLSQWHSFLFLNIGIRQSRKTSDRHESDFNFDLVETGFTRLGYRSTSNLAAVKKNYLRMSPPNPFGTVESRQLKIKGYRVVHPGMGGSALNWPIENFREVILNLSADLPVVITGTKADQKFLKNLADMKDQKNILWLVDQLKVYELLDILSQAKSVIAPSTGVLHLAASLGTPVVGIYSPRRVEHPRRWGPKGASTAVLVPPAQEADRFHPDIMKEIKPEAVVEAVHALENGFRRHENVNFPSA